MPFSLHTARWLSQLNNEGFEIHLYASMGGQVLHESIKGITVHENFYESVGTPSRKNSHRSISLKLFSFIKQPFLKKMINKGVSVAGVRKSRAASLLDVIKEVKPDIIHSMETQHAGY